MASLFILGLNESKPSNRMLLILASYPECKPILKCSGHPDEFNLQVLKTTILKKEDDILHFLTQYQEENGDAMHLKAKSKIHKRRLIGECKKLR
eukprot:1149004_1